MSVTPTDVMAATGLIGATGFIYWAISYFIKRIKGQHDGNKDCQLEPEDNSQSQSTKKKLK